MLTIPAKQALAAGMRKIKMLTRRGTTSLSLAEMLRTVNPVLRGWAAYFRYGASKKTFSCLGSYAWWRLILWIRRKHPHLTWKRSGATTTAPTVSERTILSSTTRRRCGSSATASAAAKSRPPTTSTKSTRTEHAFVRPATTMPPSSARSANNSPNPTGHTESRMLGQRARPVRRAGTRKPTPATVHGASSPTRHMELDRRGAEPLFQVLTEREERSAIAIASNEAFSGWTKTFTHGSAPASSTGSPSPARLSKPAPSPTVLRTLARREATHRVSRRHDAEALPDQTWPTWPNSWLELPDRPESPNPRWWWMKTPQCDPLPHSIR
jgi:hypothetical protein